MKFGNLTIQFTDIATAHLLQSKPTFQKKGNIVYLPE
jgi:hypothetical protein